MEPLLLIVILIAAAVIGVGLGWLLTNRQAATLRAERDENLQKFRDAIKDIETEQRISARIPKLEDDLKEVTSQRDVALRQLAGIQAGASEREESYRQQLKRIEEAEERLKVSFGQLASQALTDAQALFLNRANDRFTEAEKVSAAKLQLLLKPVEDTLQRYEANLKEMEGSRRGAYEGLKQQILLMREGQERVAREAHRLQTTLRSSTGTVGRWGEEQCRNALERAGLQEGIDFEEQVSADATGDRARPDFIVRLSGDRRLIIDVKCSLDSYFGAIDAEDEVTRERLLMEHGKAIKLHAQGLGRKTYQEKFGNASSFVVMFVPGENFLHAAIQADRKLLSWGQEHNVLIVGPTNLVSLALTVASLRNQEKMAARAEEIAKIGKRLYDNLSTLGKNAHAMSRSIHSMVANWNQLVGTLDGSLLSSARKFDELGMGKSSPDVRDLEPLDPLIREPQKLLATNTVTDTVKLADDDTAEAAE